MHQPGYPFTFTPSACETCPGRCCTGESGSIWVQRDEVRAIAGVLKCSEADVLRDYTHRVGYRVSLNEKPWANGEFACVFYEDGCSIYEARPKQCRTFPFWPRYKRKRHLPELMEECPGVFPGRPKKDKTSS